MKQYTSSFAVEKEEILYFNKKQGGNSEHQNQLATKEPGNRYRKATNLETTMFFKTN